MIDPHAAFGAIIALLALWMVVRIHRKPSAWHRRRTDVHRQDERCSMSYWKRVTKP